MYIILSLIKRKIWELIQIQIYDKIKNSIESNIIHLYSDINVESSYKDSKYESIKYIGWMLKINA